MQDANNVPQFTVNLIRITRNCPAHEHCVVRAVFRAPVDEYPVD